MATREGSPAVEVNLQALTVNLIGFEPISQFVNPVTLHVNGVVDDTWTCEKGARIGITESSFSYTNGVHVDAIDDTISIRQYGSPLVPGSALSAKFAKRYIDAFGVENWIAVSLEFVARIQLSVESSSPAVRPWPRFADAPVFQGFRPLFGLDAFYEYPDRRIRVELRQNPGFGPSCLTCFGWVHRRLHDAPGEAQPTLDSALDGWESDWNEVIDAASRLIAATLAPGG